ncbi:MAG: hypothetical protein J6Q38_04745 [Clostridia bacterium]|nr:hypothetical protein [Clostridia bacterium]
MSIGKKSIARAASAVAMAENTAEETVVTTAEVVAEAVETAEPNIEKENVIDERFKNVSVGDAMPAFLL